MRQPLEKDVDWQALLAVLAKTDQSDIYVIDSCPMSVCHNQRASRCRVKPSPEYAVEGDLP